jgi:hypothetical protein
MVQVADAGRHRDGSLEFRQLHGFRLLAPLPP